LYFIFGSLQKQEMQKNNIASIGPMDPSKVNEFEVKHQPDTTIATIYLTVATLCECHLIVFANSI
jgi:hypothetical protein